MRNTIVILLLTTVLGCQTVQIRHLPRTPVLFIHGHSKGAEEVWQTSDSLGTSFAAALAHNPDLRIDPFYLDLPLHVNGLNQDQSIEADADTIVAEVDRILAMPRYRRTEKLVIVGYSQGGLSGRYYIKKYTDCEDPSTIKVSQFISLATPNHGTFVGALLGQPDRATRQMCGGRIFCWGIPSCTGFLPPACTTNVGTDLTFLDSLNGHPLVESCSIASAASEAPCSSQGILYLNLYATNNKDRIVGGATLDSADCMGRRLALNHAPDAINVGVDISDPEGRDRAFGEVHVMFPHHWTTICYVLKTISEGQVPENKAAALEGLIHPPVRLTRQ